jgi:DNA-binding transcriptional ArsR family regulator
MVSTSTVAEIGALLGDPGRVNMMIALLDGRAWTARELADVAGVSPQTASSHLAKLVGGRMVCVERQGRHRYHRISSVEIAQLLEQMHLAGAALARSRVASSGPRDQEMRELRSCYDHLAGRIAVELGSKLLEDQLGQSRLSTQAEPLLRRIAIDVDVLARGRRVLCRTCIDWSERKRHISGAVGAALLNRFGELGWIKARVASRALVLTAAGEQGLAEVFGIRAVRSGT